MADILKEQAKKELAAAIRNERKARAHVEMCARGFRSKLPAALYAHTQAYMAADVAFLAYQRVS